MKRILAALCVIAVLFSLAACSNIAGEIDESGTNRQNQLTQSNIETTDALTSETQPKQADVKEDDTMLKMEIMVGSTSFTATLYDNAAAKALIEQLPMTLNMSELNGNEKYDYLDHNLPTDPGRPSEIKAGDLMLYGNNCLVLFYESFSTSYSYTPLGYIDDPEGLAEALGSGSVQITFKNNEF